MASLTQGTRQSIKFPSFLHFVQPSLSLAWETHLALVEGKLDFYPTSQNRPDYGTADWCMYALLQAFASLRSVPVA